MIDLRNDRWTYLIYRTDGAQYVLYNASVIGNPSDHIANKWYARRYPVTVPIAGPSSQPFDTPQDAERAIHAGRIAP
jgi:hypothetical protein